MAKEASPISRRKFQSAFHQMLETGGNMITGEKSLLIAIMHTAKRERAEELKEQIASAFDCTELFITGFTPVIQARAWFDCPSITKTGLFNRDAFF